MAGAAGGFVTRSFESMLKECSGRKYGDLQKALQSYLDCRNAGNQLGSATKVEPTSLPSTESSTSAGVEENSADAQEKASAGVEEISADAQENASVMTDEADSVVPSVETNRADLDVQSVETARAGSDVRSMETTRADSDVQLVETSTADLDVQSVETTTSVNVMEALACAGTVLEGVNSELVLQPMRLAFETKNTKLVESALDCLHKLIAYNHLEGDPGLEGGKNSVLFMEILSMVYGCVDNSSSDGTILQVLKVLLTAVASTKFRVHGESLLGVIRICYNIALSSKNPINQATSKAMLTQMVSITIRRMESVQSAHSSTGCTEDSSTVSENSNNGEVTGDDQGEKKMTLGDALSMNRGKEVPPTSVEELENLAGGADIKGLEAVLDKAVSTEDGKNVSRGIDLDNVDIEQRDALLVFRTLCKMGMKEESDDVTVKTRLLSLELLQGLLEGVSQSFTKNFHFIDSVKAYLSYALLRASVSSSPVVFQYAAGVFAVLLLKFRESLKGEIGIFFPVIILRLLDSSDGLVSQRLSVLRMLENVCRDPQMLADMFVNYDCDLESPNLFERMVNSLSRIAQGAQNAEPNSTTLAQSTSVKSSSLQCLVNVLKSLKDWEKSQRETVKDGAISCSLKEENLSMESISIEESKDREGGSLQFEKVKAQKSILEAAISEFNRKPAKGVEFLISNNLVENTAASVVHFLKNTPNLDKEVIGEYLGQHEEFPLAVMHAYVDSMKFSGLKFDVAIRELLGGFRLPGEAQKIDRIMEKFAERYCADNPGLFKNADAAYVLAYAVIMLNTDAHNPMVWPKMSKPDFVRMNTTSDGEECAPQQFLEELYDSIVKEEIKMKKDVPDTEANKSRHEMEDRGRLVSILNLALPRRKSAADMKAKSEQIVKQTQALFRKQGAKRGIFYTAKQAELVRPMLEAVGWPLLAAFSVIMEEEDTKARVFLCMEGFKAGIHLTKILGMDTMRYAFLTSLVRFTFLHAPKEMRSKNVEALRMLLSLCDTETDALQDTWNAVLECVSRLDLITSSPSIAATVMQGSNQISRDSVVQSLKELAGKPAEQVFINSVKLPSESVVEFFTALCGVSAEELKQSPARVFSLQKLVEISYYNMARIRLVWARIWSVLAYHFITAGSHSDEKIAMYAIDSLRQLGMKYLERAELANFTFQNDILKPFVVLMRNSRSEIKRGLIVDCIVQMIKSKVGSIKSGWKSVFMVFTAAADDDVESIIESAFENVEEVVLEHFDQVVGDCFMDCVNCLIRFANNKSSARISLKAIALLRICEDRLAEGLIPGGALKPVDDDLDKNFDIIEHYWFPMLAGLSDLTLDSRAEVRNCTLEVLFDLLNERGCKFSTAFWENIFHRVLFPIFDQVRYAGRNGIVASEDEWLRDTIIHSLQLLCNLFNTFYKEVSFMLPPLLGLLLDCAKRTDQSVVSISLGALVHLIEVGGHQFSDDDWDTLLTEIRDASYTTQPLELLDSLVYGNPKKQQVLTVEVDSSKEISHGDSDSYNEDSGTTPRDASSSNNSPGKYLSSSVRTKDLDFRPQLISEDSEVDKPKASGAGNLQRSQTFGQRIMGNMMDNIFIRSFTSKPRKENEDIPAPRSPLKDDVDEPSFKDEDEENPLLETVRAKCITQMLLLGALDSIQAKYWNSLQSLQKIAIMDNLLSFIEFAASYNSCSNLRTRIHQTPPERPPLNLLRQEITGTAIYLDILLKSTSQHYNEKAERGDGYDAGTVLSNGTKDKELSSDDEKLKTIAEEKLVSFCAQILKEASDLQSSVVEAASADVHQVLELRAPIIVKVLYGMCVMNNQILRKHFRELYPLITKLVCCSQLDVRGALSALFNQQLTVLLP